jgi:peptidoglycan/xylan/chitin deacetylase (PgdA/CDA1 family)
MKRQSIFARLPGAYARRVAKWFARRPFTLPRGHPIITFTFDDFPRSALFGAGSVLEASGAAGTYFVCRGLMGQTIATGEMFRADDLTHLLTHGHELGCHTFHHYPALDTTPSKYESSVAENAAALASLMRSKALQTHSYPISYPRPGTKRRVGRRFRGCRGGGQNLNHGTVDLNYLNSFFLEQSREEFGTIERIIATNADAGGWLVFSTHDVCENPTRFGCTPAFFEKVVRSSNRSGAKIMVMSAALDTLGVPPLP